MRSDDGLDVSLCLSLSLSVPLCRQPVCSLCLHAVASCLDTTRTHSSDLQCVLNPQLYTRIRCLQLTFHAHQVPAICAGGKEMGGHHVGHLLGGARASKLVEQRSQQARLDVAGPRPSPCQPLAGPENPNPKPLALSPQRSILERTSLQT